MRPDRRLKKLLIGNFLRIRSAKTTTRWKTREGSREQRGDFVFCEQDGRALDAHHLYRDFQIAQKKAGFERLIRFHDLRHTFASHFMQNGGNIYDLQKILGHSSLEMTQRYAHMSPDHLAKAIEIVSFSPSEGGNAPRISWAPVL